MHARGTSKLMSEREVFLFFYSVLQMSHGRCIIDHLAMVWHYMVGIWASTSMTKLHHNFNRGNKQSFLSIWMVARDKGRLNLSKGKFKTEMPAGCSRLGAGNSGVSKWLIHKSDIQRNKIIQTSEIHLLTSMKKRHHNFNHGNKQSFLSIWMVTRDNGSIYLTIHWILKG